MSIVEATHAKMLTPPQIAARLAIKPGKVIAWIRSGELKAVDVANRGCTRPRYRVDPSDLEKFLLRRSAGPTPKTIRRRKKKMPADFVEFYGLLIGMIFLLN